MGKNLPTEAQWEKAASGVDGRIYPWGNQGYDVVILVANIPDLTASDYFNRKADFSIDSENYSHVYDDGCYLTSPVEFFPKGISPYGAFDMAGNVEEWVYDWYSSTWNKDSTIANPVNDKRGVKNYKMTKGGSWDLLTTSTRSSHRGGQSSRMYRC